MKMKYAKIIGTLLAVSAIALTGCGKNGGDSTGNGTEDTSEWYDVSREDMEEAETTTTTEVVTEPETTTTTEDTSEPTEESSSEPDDSSSSGGDSSSGSGEKPSGGGQDKTEPAKKETLYYPDVEIYGDKNALKYAELAEITINDIDYNLTREDLDEIVKGAGLEQTDKVFKNEDEDKTDGLLWYGNGYRMQGNEGEGYLYMEVLDYDHINTGAPDVNKAGIHLRSVYINNDTAKGGLDVNVAGASCGMPRSEVEKKLGGKGDQTKGYTYYANKVGAILLHYDESDNVDEIYVFADYDYFKIKYIN